MAKLTHAEIADICEVYRKTNNQLETAEIVKRSPATVSKYLIANGLGCGRGGNQKRKITDEEILKEIADGLTRQEIADKYGVHVEHLARLMHKLGVHAKHAKPIAISSTKEAKDWHYTNGCANMISATVGERFAFDAYKDRRVRIKCKTCGNVIERAITSVRRGAPKCDYCEEQKKIAQERERLVNVLSRVLDAETPKVCPTCGTEFTTKQAGKLYCSDKCKAKAKKGRNGNSTKIRKRCRHYGVEYVPGVTLKAVYNRDKGICKICGQPTNWNDGTWNGYIGPMYPTIDHIVALKNGGGHTWDNVQLAHAICNSYKRDLAV